MTSVFNSTTHLQYQPSKKLPWISFNWRYDSGLVAGPAPCAGGNCANGPNGTDSIVDVSGITPDQQFQAGLFCGNVFATPTSPISPDGTCPANLYGSKYLQIPAPGTEDDDHNPPRIASRNLFDIAVGHDNILHGDKYQAQRARDCRQPDEQGGSLQFHFDVQRNALRDAADSNRNGRFSLLIQAGERRTRCSEAVRIPNREPGSPNIESATSGIGPSRGWYMRRLNSGKGCLTFSLPSSWLVSRCKGRGSSFDFRWRSCS